MTTFAGLPLPELGTDELDAFMTWLVAVNRHLRKRRGVSIRRAGLRPDEVMRAFHEAPSPLAGAERLAARLDGSDSAAGESLSKRPSRRRVCGVDDDAPACAASAA
ncbi:hypothetical protein NK718_17370 [Alsobacter sp. SYSU M60028]|uniref:Uncharacterized protein n=1 Tax=Alsobacter ponti TaxID=2962936 RepID=A0ABT1LFT8_9HYPH|nr:hypothetical protein [Alsobacter ponti]MCP8940299.1 hypothetical protein [Alsobacter ponti]